MLKKPAVLGGEPTCSTPLPFVRPHLPSLQNLQDLYEEILKNGMVTTGPYAVQLGKEIANYLGVQYAVPVSSCTAGLLLAFQALGLPEGSEVVLPSFTFMASGLAPVWNRLRLRFADVDLETMNVTPEQIEEALTPNTTAIIGVHQFGNPAPVESLQELAQKRGIALLFDAAHGFGALHHQRPLGRYGKFEVFSMSPTKLLVAGEGGIVATDDEEIANHVIMGRNYGNLGNYDCLFPGMNARMSEFHAIVALKSLDMLEVAAQHRNRVADFYRERLKELPGIHFQKIEFRNRSSYKDLSIIVDEHEFGMTRDLLANALHAEGIHTRVYYSPVLHRMKAFTCYSEDNIDNYLPNTLYLETHALSLPIYSDMSEEEANCVCETIELIHHHAKEIAKR